ncbi:restriction endonuclease subunit S [Veillonella sp.]|uniref:restriction endonuclease subunit S n=1 Tax=Veillonella sp. TaxID=1926307 RepID=UPI0025F72585|nr:restriction endonuclease subunit S [Veillonella sp.]
MWQVMSLGDVCTISSSKRIFAKEYKTEGIPFYRGKEIIEKHNGSTVSTELFISLERYEEIKSKYDVPKKGDILLSSVGTLGVPWLVNEDNFYFKDGNLTWLRSNEKIIPDYLYFWLTSDEAQNQIDSKCIGSTQKALTIEALKKFKITLPNVEVQKKIVSMIKPIELKIDINRRINNNLEQQAQAIFKSWFVDLEPFSNRKPSDWSVSTLGNVSIMGAGGDKPQNVSPIKTDLYKYPIYSNGLSNEGLYGFTDKPKISEESVTVSARGTIGFVCLRHIPYVPIVRLVTLTPKTEIISAKYLYLWLKQLHITGTGTTQQQLTVPDFQKTEILVPSQEIVTLFTATVDPIFEKIWANQNENEKLSSLRDTLLPKLISGELDVSSIDL